MGKHDSRIPPDPVKNLTRLKDINTHMTAKLERKLELFNTKKTSCEKMEELVRGLGKAEDLSQEEHDDAARREQILMRYQIELEDLDREIQEMEGRLDWNERQQGIVEEIVNRKEDLTYKPFEDVEKVASATAAE